MRVKSNATTGGTVLAYIFVFAALLSLFFWLTMVFWNGTMPHIFGLPRIGFWTAGALWGLIRVLHPFAINKQNK